MTIKKTLLQKARQSGCRYKVSAIAFNIKGEILGVACNKHYLNKLGGSRHAEQELINRYGTLITEIIICRSNKTGSLCKIEPCKNCQKRANKMNIKIKSLGE